ncbi:MAG: sensor histidine kinase [Mongoliibacter sp.]|uniref:sensor histidine kinase n=1 Tax=Mongoliibacter sp. TaxID=2022438 RepID=UPI0012F338C6|nr:sensor histidine kinase [Mongoliibacter sp.]TVP51978.1 MAG: sensor histidine kinase [Mongoliibacter sp.]
MKNYFSNLVGFVIDSFNTSDRIIFHCDMELLEMDVENAIPLVLIVNELITNSLKYALYDNREGEIAIHLSKNSFFLNLKVKDDGIGMQDLKEVEGSGFGSQLINLLTKQFEGKMSSTTIKGAEINF